MSGRTEAQPRFYRGSSMAPTFRLGDWLVLEEVQFNKIRPGDIVVYKNTVTLAADSESAPRGHRSLEEFRSNISFPIGDIEPPLCVHRVIEMRPGGLITRGDNNSVPDKGLLTPDRLLGRVVALEHGRRRNRIHGGKSGLCLSLVRRTIRKIKRLLFEAVRFIFRPVYRPIIRSGIIALIWKPRLITIRFNSPQGPFEKIVHNGRSVAVWWPESRCLECRRPYDLIIKGLIPIKNINKQ